MNADESFFRTNQYNEETWAKTRSTDVNLNTKSNDKEGFTFLATISYDGTAYPLILIAKGTTQLCEKHWFGPNHHINSSSAEIMQEVDNPYFQLAHK